MTLPSFRTLGTATNTTNNLQLPSGAVSTGSDLWSPLQSLLVGLNVLPTDADLDKADGLAGLLQGPPQSVAILEAGATAAAKAWTALASVVGGGTVIWAAATDFWHGEKPGIQIALVGGAAFVLAACLIGIAMIVSADVRGRALGASAMYEARRTITIEFLRLSASAHSGDHAPKTAARSITELACRMRAKVES